MKVCLLSLKYKIHSLNFFSTTLFFHLVLDNDPKANIIIGKVAGW